MPEPTDVRELVEPEVLARRFHEAYERLAPQYGYETRQESAVPWENVPGANKALMVAVAREVSEPVRRFIEQAQEREEELNDGYLDLQKNLERAKRDLRSILKAWALGDADQMSALMLGSFLAEFGKAPDVHKDAAQAAANPKDPATPPVVAQVEEGEEA